jgi:hypothetical protein
MFFLPDRFLPVKLPQLQLLAGPDDSEIRFPIPLRGFERIPESSDFDLGMVKTSSSSVLSRWEDTDGMAKLFRRLL